jgi:hypothetical protein
MSALDLDLIGAQRKQLWANGYPPVAVLSHTDPDPKKAGKAPLRKNWVADARKSPPQGALFNKAIAIAANTGIACHGLRPIDVDCGDRDRADAIEALAFTIFGSTIVRRRANSFRRLLLYRAADGEPRKRTLKGTTYSDSAEPEKVEVLGNGQQFVALGFHASDGGTAIYWVDNVGPLERPRDQLPAVTEEQVSRFFTGVAPLIGAQSPDQQRPRPGGDTPSRVDLADGDLTRIRDALLSWVPADDRQDWIRIGAALYHATDGSDEGRAVWDEWSATSEKYRGADEIRCTWASFARDDGAGPKTGLGTIIHLVRQHGGTLRLGTREDASPPERPNTTMDALRAQHEAGVKAWVNGDGPKHVVNAFWMGTRKNDLTIRLLGPIAKAKRKARADFITQWRYKNGGSAADAAKAADQAGVTKLRVACAGPNHGLLAQHVGLAQACGLLAAHDAGYDRTSDPQDPNSPPLCSQTQRVSQARQAGESVRLVACGIDRLGPTCKDREGCRKWQRINECIAAEFVAMPIERLTEPFLGQELRRFDYVLIDEPDNRVLRPETDLKVDLLDDYLFDRAPCWVAKEEMDDETGNKIDEADDETIDDDATAEARAIYKVIRDAINSHPNGYWNRTAMEPAGVTVELLDRFITLSDMRDHASGLTAGTPDPERETLARTAFRRQARKLCAFGRLARAVQAEEEGEGRLELAGDEQRVCLMRPRPKLNSEFLKARIMVTGARLNLDDVRRWLPDAKLMDGADGIPETPHQTLVHIHVATGKKPMQDPMRQRFVQALVRSEADAVTGVAILKDHEELLANIPNVSAGHHGAMIGLNRDAWMNCTTFINFGPRFLGAEDAAAAGAADTGETVPVKPPVRRLRQIALRGGKTACLPIREYEHPAARAANALVRDYDILQGMLGRPRACDRTPATPVTVINVSTTPANCCEHDFVIRNWGDYAPQRMVVALAERGFIVESSLGRYTLLPDIYTQPWTGQNDRRLETGGFMATVLRGICLPWRDGPREPYVIGRLWRSGHAYRESGEAFVATMASFPALEAEAQERYGATRIAVDRFLWPARPLTPAEELSITPEIEEWFEIIDSVAQASGNWPPGVPQPDIRQPRAPPDD